MQLPVCWWGQCLHACLQPLQRTVPCTRSSVGCVSSQPQITTAATAMHKPRMHMHRPGMHAACSAARSLLVLQLDKVASILWQQHLVTLLYAHGQQLAGSGAAAWPHCDDQPFVHLGTHVTHTDSTGQREKPDTAGARHIKREPDSCSALPGAPARPTHITQRSATPPLHLGHREKHTPWKPRFQAGARHQHSWRLLEHAQSARGRGVVSSDGRPTLCVGAHCGARVGDAVCWRL